MQSEKLRFGRPAGSSRVREVFLDKQDALDYIGPRENKYIKCKTCGTKHVNPKADLDHNYQPWRRKLWILEEELK